LSGYQKLNSWLHFDENSKEFSVPTFVRPIAGTFRFAAQNGRQSYNYWLSQVELLAGF
jgi:hypothetical protein